MHELLSVFGIAFCWIQRLDENYKKNIRIKHNRGLLSVFTGHFFIVEIYFVIQIKYLQQTSQFMLIRSTGKTLLGFHFIYWYLGNGMLEQSSVNITKIIKD